VWIANFQGGSVSELAGAGANAPGSALSSAKGFTASALIQPFAVAIDPSGNLWVTNFGSDSVTEFIGVAAPVKTPLIGVPSSPP
jgi:streptogramin lyase